MGAQAESEYLNVYVYDSNWGCVPRLSALVVTSNGDVFGAGANSLVRGNSSPSDYPMIEGRGEVLSDWVKIDKLCGLGIRKFTMGFEHGAALTNTDEMLIWGRNAHLPNLIDERVVVTVEAFQPNTRCQLCTTIHDYTKKKIGKAELNYCKQTKKHKLCTKYAECLPVRQFVKCDDSCYTHCCENCFKEYTSTKVMNGIPLYYCKGCDLLWDLSEGLAGRQQKEIFFTRVSVEGGIADVASIRYGLWILTGNNKLVWQDSRRGLAAKKPDNVKMKVVNSCRGGTLVTSDDGSLYRIRIDNDSKRFVYILDKVSLPAAVTKLCCGMDAAACMLLDNSVWIIYPGPKNYPPQHLGSICKGGTDTFQDIAAAYRQDKFYIQTDKSSVLEWSDMHGDITFIFSETNCNKKLIEDVCTQSIPSARVTTTSMSGSAYRQLQLLPDLPQPRTEKKSPLPSVLQPYSQSHPSPSAQHRSAPASNPSHGPAFLKGLYGRKVLSNVTFQLSDGDFPAHQCVLTTNSAYFKKTFSSDNCPHKIFDVTSYNPSAFRCLLKYFYEQPPDEIDVDGLFDLCQLANSYGEIILARETEEKIKEKVNMDNALYIFALSKWFGFDQIKKDCEKVMKTTEFKDKLLEKAMIEPITFLLHPDNVSK